MTVKHFKHRLTPKGRAYLNEQGYDLSQCVDENGYIKDLYVGGTVIYGSDYTKVEPVASPDVDIILADIEAFKRLYGDNDS